MDNVRARDFIGVPFVAARFNYQIDDIIEVVIIDVIVGTGQIDPINTIQAGNVAVYRVAVSFQIDAILVVRSVVAA